MTSDSNDANVNPLPRQASGQTSNSFDSFTCSICGTTFPSPNFDANQISHALRQHIAANHHDQLQKAAEDAVEANPESAVGANVPVPVDADGTHEGTKVTEEVTDELASDPKSALPADSAAPAGAENSDTTAPKQHTDVDETHGNPDKAGPDKANTAANEPNAPGSITRPLPENKRSVPYDPRRAEDTGPEKSRDTTARSLPENKRSVPYDPRRAKDTGPEKSREEVRHVDDASAPGTKKKPSPANERPVTKPSTASTAKQVAQDPKSAAKQTTKRVVQKSIETAGSSVGIPPQVTRIAIKIAKRGLPLVVGMSLVVFAALSGSLFGGENAEDYVWNVPLSEQLDIPEPYLNAYLSAARRYKLPWTVLAAVGANATYHGRIDPYKQEIPLPALAAEEDDTENFILLTDADLEGVDTYLNPFLIPAGYSVDVVILPDGDVQSAANWLDTNDFSSRAPIVIALGGKDDGTPQEFAEKIDQILNLRGVHNNIYWLTLATEGAAPYNEVLRERDRLRRNLRLIDWAGIVEQRDIIVGANGALDDSGQRARAGLIAATFVGNVISAGLSVASGISGPGVLPTPTGDCPSLTIPVAGENPSQGAGPLMLMPSALNAAGYDLEDTIQNICSSVDTLAEVLFQSARLIATAEGTTFPSGIANLALRAIGGDASAAERVHRFWAKVLDTSGVLGDTAQRECVLPEKGSLDDQAHVGNMIDSYWRCTLAGTGLVSVDSVTVDAAGNVEHRILNQPEAIARGVEEALSVAWTWGAWGTIDCDDTAVHAGVFPLTETVFAKHADNPTKGRCDRDENIKAAAKAFAARESVAVASRGGKWSAALGGWALIGPVGGPVGPTNFDAIGPWQPLYVGAECTPVLVDAVIAIGNENTFLSGYTAGQAQEIAFTGTFDEFDTTGARAGSTLTIDEFLAINAELDARLDALIAAAQANPVCAQERAYAKQEWLGVLTGAVSGDALTAADGEGVGPRIPPTTRGNLDTPNGIGDRIAALSGRAGSRSGGWGGVLPAGSAYLQRLSTVRVALTSRPLVARESDESTLSIGYRLVNLAVGYYGGIFIGNDGAKSVGIGFVDETVPFSEDFNSVGQEYGVDPRLLAAVARQESNFNPEAGCNPSGGAFGMMQKEYDTVPTLCGDTRRQIVEAARMLLDLYEKAGDWKGALWGYDNGALFADAWAELGGDEVAARQYAIVYYRDARNPLTGQTYCPVSGACPRAESAMTYISETPGDRSAMLAWFEYQGLFPALVLNTRQTVVNGTECPNVAPRSAIAGMEPLRGGALEIGIRTLCVESVAEAPTPEAARAIIFAFNNLGILYSQDLRSTSSAFDCSSYVSRAYESGGLLMNSGGAHFNTRQLLPWDGGSRPEWVVPVSPHLAKPGDMVFPQQGHVAMRLTRGFVIHTNRTGDISHVTLGGASYANPLQTNRVVPELAPRLGS